MVVARGVGELTAPLPTNECSDATSILLCREAYGILQGLAMRPLSEGDDGALLSALVALRTIEEKLADIGTGDHQLTALRFFIGQIDRLPPTMIARTLVRSLESRLLSITGSDVEFPQAFTSPAVTPRSLEKLVVQVGPTIGVGDETLLARAWLERAQHMGVRLAVCTRRPDLWVGLEGEVGVLPPPPFGAIQHLSACTQSELNDIGYLFADFLRSDPCPSSLAAVGQVRMAGRWFMGAMEGDLTDVPAEMRYVLHYPQHLPACRWLECRWAAAQFLPRSQGAGILKSRMWREPTPRSDFLLLQTLTSKPELMLPSAFYRDVFMRAYGVLGRSFKIEVLPAPTHKGQAIVVETVSALQRTIGKEWVHHPPSMRLDEIYGRVASSALLFGIDTFSSHFAAQAGTPQITIHLPEHTPWLSVGAPCFSITNTPDRRHLMTQCAYRLAATLNLIFSQTGRNIADAGVAWRALMRTIDHSVLGIIQGNPPPVEYLQEQVVAAQRLYLEHATEVGRVMGLAWPARLPAFCRFNALVYDNEIEAGAAVARWYQAIAISEVSAALAVVPPASGCSANISA